MKEKIINYIETLEAKAYQSDDYFKQRNELYISNQEKDKEIERLHSIIKEVREYIEKELSFNVVINRKENKVIGYNKAFDKILEILEKDGNNEKD